MNRHRESPFSAWRNTSLAKQNKRHFQVGVTYIRTFSTLGNRPPTRIDESGLRSISLKHTYPDDAGCLLHTRRRFPKAANQTAALELCIVVSDVVPSIRETAERGANRGSHDRGQRLGSSANLQNWRDRGLVQGNHPGNVVGADLDRG